MLDTSLLLRLPYVWLLLPGVLTYRYASHILKRALSRPFLLALAIGATAICQLAVGTAILLMQSIHWRLVLDAPLMHYIAWRIQHGAVPYRDIFDMNLPGAYLIHIAVLKLFGPSDTGWRLFDLLWLAGTSAMLWNYCRHEGWLAGSLSILFFAAYHLSCGPTSMGQRDYLEFTFLLAGVSLATRAWNTACDWRYLFSAGLALGFAASIKPTAILLWIALTLMTAAQAGRQRQKWHKPAAALAGGGLLVVGLFAAWLGTIGGLKPFAEIIVGFVLPIYPKFHSTPFLEYLQLYASMWFTPLLVVGAVLFSGRLDTRYMTLVIGCLYGFLHYVLQGKGWLYHLYPLIGFTSALCACTLARAMRKTPGRRQFAQIAAAFCFIFALADGSARLQASLEAEQHIAVTVADMQRDLAEIMRPGDTVQPFDTAGGCVNALLRLHIYMPTRFLYDFPFLTERDAPYLRALRRQVLQDVQAHPPTFLLIYRWGWPTGQYERLNNFPELKQWMLANYDLTARRDHYAIYERRGHHRANRPGV